MVQYTIKHITLKSGKEIYIPLARVVSTNVIARIIDFSVAWQRIVKVYDKYVLLDIFNDDEDLGLTKDDCLEHIDGYKKSVETSLSKEVFAMDFITV